MSDHADPVNVFTDAELAAFQAEDYAAGRAVVALMLAIFSTGVVLYTIVAYAVMS